MKAFVLWYPKNRFEPLECVYAPSTQQTFYLRITFLHSSKNLLRQNTKSNFDLLLYRNRNDHKIQNGKIQMNQFFFIIVQFRVVFLTFKSNLAAPFNYFLHAAGRMVESTTFSFI